MAKIPPHAKKVFTGEIFEIYQWPQKMFDGTIETFEMAKRPNTVDVLAITPDGKILVLDQEQPGRDSFVCIPGGRIDAGEDPLTAAKRELLEETGYASDDVELYDSVEPTGKIEWTLFIFVARGVVHRQDQELDAGEKIHVREVTLDEFLRMVADGEMRDTSVTRRIERACFDPAARAALEKKLSIKL